MNTEATPLLARRRQALGASYRLFYEEPFAPVRGEGVWLYDQHGTPHLDAYNNVASIGHCHPAVVQAIAEQSALLNTHTRYLHPSIVDYAEDLLSEFPPPLNNLTLTCTGSEANDLALRVAQCVTGGTGMLVTRWAYHGVSNLLAQLSPSLATGLPTASHVRLIDAPDTYRGNTFVESVTAALEDLRAHGIRPAALLTDSIFSSDGVFTPSQGELAQAAQRVRAAGGLYIADEVQAGFGRTGAHRWGFQCDSVIPDLVTLGKPMGNGHPVAGVVGRAELFDAFGHQQRYFNTYGGNPVSCKAAQAVLDVLRQEDLQANAQRVGEYLRQGLHDLAVRHPAIGDVRGQGLFIGVELIDSPATRLPATALASHVVNGMRRRQVLISATGPRSNVLKIRPPLVFTREHADLLLERLSATLAELP
ncbi:MULTISPECIES: aminotransferase class III-fold pyridoxal phosphate-dependent enzyme [unclassified Pseudomonas]|uniref:aspartate aminotransferase family protein n=1 Tax=unclassified Pseudomonas TaxID=196821 RepID=UPI000D35D757|nr:MULTISPECIES: aminotransferase class III-fold pyridoxal phosphate-dependent enzyme [unclassified Pseudomonas]RAU44597.1 aspartate aminotransferase family protein [Pseudomonas sp. RIT 409]RAU54967.1 aspartate aminotransferase family protein [Pseudomonas sp. RIT 412]